MILTALTLFVVYVLGPIVAYGFVNQFLFIKKTDDRLLVLLCCLGWGPALLSFFNSWLMLVVSGLPFTFYRLAILAFILLSLFWQRDQLKYTFKDFVRIYSKLIRPLWKTSFMSRFVTLVFVGLILLLVVATQVGPVVGNDSLEYRKVAEHLTDTRDFGNYPIHNTENAKGLYAPWSHPPGFFGLAVVTNILMGKTIWDFGFKLMNPMYILFSILLMMGVVRLIFCKPSYVGIFSGFILLSTPVFAWQAVLVHVDSFRLFFVLATGVCLFLTIENRYKKNKIKLLILTGVAAGVGIFAHSLGLLTLPMICLSYFLLGKPSFKQRILDISLMMIVALLTVSKTILNNFFINGSIASDLSAVKVISLEKLKYGEFLEISRGLGSELSLIFNGFVNRNAFGYSYWYLIFSLVVLLGCYLKGTKKVFDSRFRLMFFISVSYIISFYIIVCATLIIGSHALVKNNRYYLCVHLFVSLLGGLGLWEFISRVLGEKGGCDEAHS